MSEWKKEGSEKEKEGINEGRREKGRNERRKWVKTGGIKAREKRTKEGSDGWKKGGRNEESEKKNPDRIKNEREEKSRRRRKKKENKRKNEKGSKRNE